VVFLFPKSDTLIRPKTLPGITPLACLADNSQERQASITMKVSRNFKWSDINMAELNLTKLVTHFAQSNKAEGKSPKTVSWYTEMLTDFATKGAVIFR